MLLSNTYTATVRWDDIEKAWKMMKERTVVKALVFLREGLELYFRQCLRWTGKITLFSKGTLPKCL
jgi:hypothetical protein